MNLYLYIIPFSYFYNNYFRLYQNSTFPPCIWLLRGFCLELYPYCLFRGHGIVFFVLTKTFQPREWSRACVCVGQRPRPLPRLKSRGQNKMTITRSRFKLRDTILGKFPQQPNIGGKVLLYTDPPNFRGREVIQGQLLRIFFF